MLISCKGDNNVANPLMKSRILLVAIISLATVAVLFPSATAHQPSVVVKGSLILGNETLILDSSAMTVAQNLTGHALISLTSQQVIKSYASLGGFVSGTSIFLVGLVTKSDDPALVNAVVEIHADASTGSVILYFDSIVQNVQLQNTSAVIKT